MVARRKVGVTLTPTKNKMNIYLLNIPFAIFGVAIAIVPLIIGMRHQARTEPTDAITDRDTVGRHHDVEREYDLAA
jgi:hypothetical protein